MIDLHCHIVPGVDDGAPDIDCSRRMLEVSAAQGVREIVCSSHASADMESYGDNFASLAEIAQEYSLKLYKGAEYFRKDIFSPIENVPVVTPGGNGFILLDCGHAHIDNVFISKFMSIFVSGYKVVLAHPERLWADDPVASVEKLLHTGEVWCQINSGSLLGSYGRQVRRAAWKLVDAGMCHIIASDAHRETGCTLKACRDMLSDFYPETLIELWFSENPRRVIAGEHPVNCRIRDGRKPFLRWLKKL